MIVVIRFTSVVIVVVVVVIVVVVVVVVVVSVVVVIPVDDIAETGMATFVTIASDICDPFLNVIPPLDRLSVLSPHV